MTLQYNQYTQEISKTTVASQTSLPKGTQSKNYVVATEQPPGNQTGNEPVPFRDCFKNCLIDIQNSEQHVTTKITGDTTIPPVTRAAPLIEERLAREKQTHEVYLPFTSTVVLKRKQEMIYMPPGFQNNPTVDCLGRLMSIPQCSCPERFRYNRTELSK